MLTTDNDNNINIKLEALNIIPLWANEFRRQEKTKVNFVATIKREREKDKRLSCRTDILDDEHELHVPVHETWFISQQILEKKNC